MIQLTIIRIEGYGPWTLTLGYDREAELQMLQAKIYYDVQRLFHEKGSLVYFNRFDEYFAITNGLSVEEHAQIQRELGSLYKNLKMSMAIGSGKTALEASMNAYNARKNNQFSSQTAQIFGDKLSICSNSGDDDSNNIQSGITRKEEEKVKGKEGSSNNNNDNAENQSSSLPASVQIMHIDVDSSTKLTGRLSPYEVTALVMKLYGLLAEEFLKLNALTFFLGGDNFMVISNGVSAIEANGILKKVTADLDIKLNCGIGICNSGRRAAESATKALDTIRIMRDEGKIQTIYEVKCHHQHHHD